MNKSRANISLNILYINIVKIMILLSIVLALLFSIVFTSKASNSKEQYYKSILIEKGDTLSSIARDYKSAGFDDIDSYLYEINRINHKSNDTIHEGCYLIIPYNRSI